MSAAARMVPELRRAHYERTNGTRRLTAPQQRRLRLKAVGKERRKAVA